MNKKDLVIQILIVTLLAIAIVWYAGWLRHKCPERPEAKEGMLWVDFDADYKSTIEILTPTHTIDDLLDAIELEESEGNAGAVGQAGEIGAYQITKKYVDDVNRIVRLKRPDTILLIGDLFRYENRFDKKKSREMTMIFTEHYGTIAWNKIWANGYKATTENAGWMRYFELQARIHNSGPDGWRNDSRWFVRNRGYILEDAVTKINNSIAYWEKIKARMEEGK